MTQPYNLIYTNQDLRNHSFKERNLTRANFSDSDIRGCDFSKAVLVGANFERVRTGRSLKQLIVQVASAICFSIFSAVILAVAFISGSEGLVPTSLSSAVSATVIFIAAAYTSAGNMFAAFNHTNTVSGITFGTGTIICIGFAIYFLLASVKAIRDTTETSFKDADLTDAKFNDAVLQSKDFRYFYRFIL